eukprot:XP_001700858.1 predicted protein [Chlamydomonas reinhardtii]
MADGAEDPRRGPLDTGTERYQKLKQTQVPRDEQEVPLEYQKLVEPHVASFNYFIGEGLQNVVESLQPVEVTHPTTGLVTRIWLSDVRVEKPLVAAKEEANEMGGYFICNGIERIIR